MSDRCLAGIYVFRRIPRYQHAYLLTYLQ